MPYETLVTELYKMNVDELQDFKNEGARELDAMGIPPKVRDLVIKIVDIVIQVKQKGMGETA